MIISSQPITHLCWGRRGTHVTKLDHDWNGRMLHLGATEQTKVGRWLALKDTSQIFQMNPSRMKVAEIDVNDMNTSRQTANNLFLLTPNILTRKKQIKPHCSRVSFVTFNDKLT